MSNLPIKDIIEEYKDNSLRQIAKKYNVSHTFIRHILRKNGVKLRKTGRRLNTKERRCHICKEIMPLELFSKCKSRPAGREYACKACSRKKQRLAAIKYTHGITLESFYVLLKQQKGGCAICGSKAGKRRLCVDHNHNTGQIRGILCNKCNTAIGMFFEDVYLLQQAIEYLQKHKIKKVV